MDLINSIRHRNEEIIGGLETEKKANLAGKNASSVPAPFLQKSCNGLIDTYVTLNNANSLHRSCNATTRGLFSATTNVSMTSKTLIGTTTLPNHYTGSVKKLGSKQIPIEKNQRSVNSLASKMIAPYGLSLSANLNPPLTPQMARNCSCLYTLKENLSNKSLIKSCNNCNNNSFSLMAPISKSKCDLSYSDSHEFGETQFPTYCSRTSNYDTFVRTSISPHSLLKSPSLTTQSSIQNMLSSNSTNPSSSVNYQKPLVIGDLESSSTDHTLAQKVRLISIIAVSAFLGLFACFLTIYLVVERLWFWQGVSASTNSVYSSNQIYPDHQDTYHDPSNSYEFLGDYQPILDAHSAKPLNLIHPKLNKTSMKVFYDFVNYQIIIKTEVSNDSLCYLKDLILPPELTKSGNINSILRELSSESYVNSILEIETEMLYNPKDQLDSESHGAKTTEVCSKSKLFQLVPMKVDT